MWPEISPDFHFHLEPVALVTVIDYEWSTTDELKTGYNGYL